MLLVDEPTSGLDPASEAHLMEQFHLLGRRGTTVVCTTHLMDNLALLDMVLVLGLQEGTGRLAYAGPPESLLPHFACRGYADLYERLEGGRFELAESVPERSLPDRNGKSDRRPGSVADSSGRSRFRSAAPHPWGGPAGRRRSPRGGSRPLLVAVPARESPRPDPADAGPGLVLAILAQPVILGVLVSLTQYDISKLLPLLFFAVVVTIWLGLNNSVRDLVRERRHYVRDRLAGLRPGAYLGAKTVVHILMGVVQILLLLAVLCIVGNWEYSVRGGSARPGRPLGNPRSFLALFLSYLGGLGARPADLDSGANRGGGGGAGYRS